ncbi:hypothetical protein BU17DRAFT_72387 [Hysterangium stoloniferum]|nr:hypothetical protein BU17DRAFT_72387 [Hysterangium stoloniferum]
MEREVIVADDERVSMARDDGLVMWRGSDPRPRDWSRVLVKILAMVLTLAVLASLLVMGLHIMPFGSGPPFGLTGCFFVDEMPPKFAFGVLPLLIYENSSLLPHVMEGNSEFQRWIWVSIFMRNGRCQGSTVTPPLDEFYRFHTVIGEQIGE